MTHDFATLTVYRSLSVRRSQRWRWRLVHVNGRVLCSSGEGYTDRAEALRQACKIVGGEYKEAVLPHQ